MQPQPALKLRPLWLTLGWLLVASVWYLSLTPKPPQIDLGIDFFDKISHFTAYAIMMGWFMQLYYSARTRFIYALGFICMGIAIEFVQGMGPHRLFEVADMLANSMGALVSLSFMRTGFCRQLWHIEQKIFN